MADAEQHRPHEAGDRGRVAAGVVPPPSIDGPEGTRESLALASSSLTQFNADMFPPNADGQVHLARVIMEAAAAEIDAYLSRAEGRS